MAKDTYNILLTLWSEKKFTREGINNYRDINEKVLTWTRDSM